MGGEGAMMQAIHSLRNNSRRNKREAFSHLSGESDSESQGIKVEPVSEEVLKEIRNKLKKQRKTDKIINTICVISGIIALIFLIWLSTLYF
ncbi:hypothetical protein [Aquimarina pacifica]|uniref:hypothetical protein n=1 Tax=Aquimarina pacifica TaxID=1296415 RepID=UPI0004709249|nr:hypothetical protein [Aquimarina pacifica]